MSTLGRIHCTTALPTHNFDDRLLLADIYVESAMPEVADQGYYSCHARSTHRSNSCSPKKRNQASP
jgi:hypothetical protein